MGIMKCLILSLIDKFINGSKMEIIDDLEEYRDNGWGDSQSDQ